jgi:hypothetical protein
MPRRRRFPYLDRLARDPLFATVPARLAPMLGQTVEELVVPVASRAECRPGDVIVVTSGHGVVTRDGVPAIAVRSGAVVDTALVGELNIALVATAPLRGWLVPRRSVGAMRGIAPDLDRALRRVAARRDPDRESSSVPRPGSQQPVGG